MKKLLLLLLILLPYRGVADMVSSGNVIPQQFFQNNQEHNDDGNINKQQTGVAIYLNPELKDAVSTYVTVSDRIMTATRLTRSGPVAIINHHAPDETKSMQTKTAHWDLLTHTVSNIQNGALKIVIGDIGDINIRWHGRYNGEESI